MYDKIFNAALAVEAGSRNLRVEKCLTSENYK
jgi:hypothetical protein